MCTTKWDDPNPDPEHLFLYGRRIGAYSPPDTTEIDTAALAAISRIRDQCVHRLLQYYYYLFQCVHRLLIM